MRLGVLQVCASLSSLTFSSRLVCFLWTVLPCLFMFTNTIAYAFRCQPRKQLYLIAFVDLVPVAKEKVSLIRWNTVWNRWKSTLSARSIRVNLNHGKEMYILSTLLIRPGQILESVARSLFTMNACDCKWFNTYI